MIDRPSIISNKSYKSIVNEAWLSQRSSLYCEKMNLDNPFTVIACIPVFNAKSRLPRKNATIWRTKHGAMKLNSKKSRLR